MNDWSLMGGIAGSGSMVVFRWLLDRTGRTKNCCYETDELN